MKTSAIVLTLALVIAGCGTESASDEAIRQGVMDYLTGRAGLDVGSMDVEVTHIEIREDEAGATVSFQAKGSTDPAAGMQMKYTLERKGNRWVVKGKSGGTGTHGGDMENPHGAMPPEAGGELPPGHPPTGGSEQTP